MYADQYEKFDTLLNELSTLPRIDLEKIRECHNKRLDLTTKVLGLITQISNMIDLFDALTRINVETVTQITKQMTSSNNTLCLLHALQGTCHEDCGLSEFLEVRKNADGEFISSMDRNPKSNIDVRDLTLENKDYIAAKNSSLESFKGCAAFRNGLCTREHCDDCAFSLHFTAPYMYVSKKTPVVDAMAQAKISNIDDLRANLTQCYEDLTILFRKVIDETDPDNLFVFTELFQYLKELLDQTDKCSKRTDQTTWEACTPLRRFLVTQFPTLMAKKFAPNKARHQDANIAQFNSFMMYYKDYVWKPNKVYDATKRFRPH